MIERYTRPAMGRIWSDEQRLRAMLRVEEELLKAIAPEKGIPAAELKAFKRLMEKSLLEASRRKESSAGHEVIGMLSAVAGELKSKAPKVDRYLHYGMTSSDALDTALALQLRAAADLLVAGWEEVARRMKSLARKHERTWMVGRTHGVHAEPITFGIKIAGWHAEALRCLKRLRAARETISYGKVSGAVGAFSQLPSSVEAEVLDALGLRPEPVSTQVVPRDRHAEYFHSLVLSACAIERVALEIRHLQKTEILELEEPFSEGQKGSSAMPHKRNPILCENLSGLARLIRSHQSAVVENCLLWHERDISHSSNERIIFPDAHIALDFMLHRLVHILDGLRVHPRRMKDNLESSQGLVFSQKVLLRLIDAGLGRLEAYDLVQRSAMKTWKGEGTLRATLGADPDVTKRLSAKDLDDCFALEPYAASAREILKRGGCLSS
ncbi:MAG TPA: adenylosuccinate lyase [Elusimicrobia bacterium]|nr:MAG: adenylosuccinate lyase [Elusimicrobia bacterium GWA2_66_18]OGR69145.1 MAG: adenylosuccinate lyase [Elusimicrobia bacterium GWC2_65_9]HAZ07181.1 adenylosuccinate lyase [Elusimicrobiota bacterium]